MKDKLTNVWVVIDEDILEVAKHNDKPAVFANEAQADAWASERLNMWVCVHINFRHRWLHHKINVARNER